MSASATSRARIGTLLIVIATAVALLTPADRADATGMLTVSFFDVGQADATLLHHDDGTVLIDAGHWQRSDVVPYLQAAGVDEIDLLIVTHPHADHIGQFDQVLDTFNVGKVWWSGTEPDTATFGRAQDALDDSDAAYLEPRVGHTRTVGDITIDVVNPPSGVDVTDIHDASLAVTATFGDSRWLFTGDAETATETRMVQQSATQLDVDVYQVSHHGSSTSTSPTFLETVDPTVAVYSAGDGNTYGHPHQEVIDRLDQHGVEVFGTDVNGTVTATTDGDTITVTPESGTAVSFAAGGGPVDEDDSPFSDISGTTHEQAIVAIVDAGITSGFPDGTFRPGGDVTRGQMAAFLDRALNLDPWDPPDPGDPVLVCVDINSDGTDLLQEIVHIGPERAQDIVAGRPWASVDQLDDISGIGPARLQDIIDQGLAATSCPGGNYSGGQAEPLPFSDVAGTTHEASILAVEQAGIAGGFPDGTFRPGAAVTRGQMATFIRNGFELPAGTGDFTDVAGTTHEAAIGAVAAADIAGGFPDGSYRPGDNVTRGQMATFLARALGLL